MAFKEYLEQEKAKPDPKWYDPGGNSPKAVVERGFWKQNCGERRC